MPEITNSTFTQIDKSAFVVASLFDESDEKAYWLTLTPQERLQALEWLRQVIYGYNASSLRLQRVFEIAQLQTS
jgi:hypothetical protein